MNWKLWKLEVKHCPGVWLDEGYYESREKALEALLEMLWNADPYQKDKVRSRVKEVHQLMPLHLNFVYSNLEAKIS